MSTTSPAPDGASSSAQAETAARPSRTRNKTQRALESEQTDRLLARARQQARESPVEPSAAASSSAATTGKGKKGTAKGKGKGKGKGKKADEVYCVCKTDGEDGRPMIECEGCKDWFHFECVGLSEAEAEKIHKYMCSGCEASTGEKTSYIYDIHTFPSPPTPPFTERRKGTKRKSTAAVQAKQAYLRVKAAQRAARKAIPTEADNASTSAADDDPEEDDDASDAESHHSSSSSSTHSASSPVTRPSRPAPQSKSDRKPSISIKPPPSKGALPPARAHVQKKLGEVVRALFGSEEMSEEEAVRYATEMECALWLAFKDVQAGKEIVGGRYKAQFNLLTSSLTHALRPDMYSRIRSRSLGPSQVATLTPIDLASAERLEELERARQAVLEQHVKATSGGQAEEIRLGRDGFEKVRDEREVELEGLRRAEEGERRRESFKVDMDEKQEGGDVVKSPETMPPPTPTLPSASATPAPPRRSASMSTPIISAPPSASPTKRTFALTSAWGEQAGDELGEFGVAEGDQMQVDLSDIVAEAIAEQDEEDAPESMRAEQEARGKEADEWEKVERLPVVWSGLFVNPVEVDSVPVPIQIRQISDDPLHPPPIEFWKHVLPHDPIAVTGRVPIQTATTYLYENRMQPSKVLLCVVLTSAAGNDDETRRWQGMADFLIGRERHGVYLPYGQTNPPGTAKELYLIPLRPSDPLPEVTDLIEGFALPKEGRTETVFLGIFVADRKTFSIPPPQRPATTQPSAPQGLGLQGDKLQELMRSLNPQALQGVLGGTTPPVGGTTPVGTMSAPFAPTPVAGAGMSPIPPPVPHTPYYAPSQHHQTFSGPPPHAQAYYPPPPPQHGAYPPYPPQQEYRGPAGPHDRAGQWRRDSRDDGLRRRDRERERSPDRRGGARGGYGGRGGGGGGGGGGGERNRDSGWGNRGRGRG